MSGHPIAVRSYRATNDIVFYGGGAITPPTHPYTCDLLGAVENFEFDAQQSGCTGQPIDIGNDCRAYQSCEGGVEVELCTRSGGHTPDSARNNWDFLSRHSKP